MRAWWEDEDRAGTQPTSSPPSAHSSAGLCPPCLVNQDEGSDPPVPCAGNLRMTDVERFCGLQTLHFFSPWISRALTFHPALQLGSALYRVLSLGAVEVTLRHPLGPLPEAHTANPTAAEPTRKGPNP